MSGPGPYPHLEGLEGHYELVRELGGGGTSVVYLARRRSDARDVAIKVLRPSFARDPDAVARLEREAEVVGRLQHPNVVPLLETRRLTHGGLALVMDYVPGPTIREVVRVGGPVSAEFARRVLRDVALALDHAHQDGGVVHRDLKPGNIYLDTRRDRFVLADFGIARAVGHASDITLSGATLGTPAYMSPEQVEGGHLDGRSDLYGLGLVGWEMLTGERPWAGRTLYEVIYKQKHEELPALAPLRPDLPEPLVHAVEGLLAKDREERWESAAAFLDELKKVRGDRLPPGWEGGEGEGDGQEGPSIEDVPTVQLLPDGVVVGHVGEPDGQLRLGWEAEAETAPKSAPGHGAVADPDPEPAPDPEPVPASPPPRRRVVVDAVHRRPRNAHAKKPWPRVRRTVVFLAFLLLLGTASWALFPERQPVSPSDPEGPEAPAGPWPDALPVPPSAVGARALPPWIDRGWASGSPTGAASAGARIPARLVAADPVPETVTAGEPLPGPLAVRVENEAGLPVAGARVVFQVEDGSGWLEPEGETTDDLGILRASFVPGSAGGEVRVVARMPDLEEGFEFRMEALRRGVPAALVTVSSSPLEALPGQALPQEVVVRVEDELGEPVEGVEVRMSPLGGGSAQPALATTGPDGTVATRWTLSADLGPQALWAEVPAAALSHEVEARAVPLLEPHPALRTGAAHTCRLSSTGNLWCWGENGAGQLGGGPEGGSERPTPVAHPLPFAAVATGAAHTCALGVDGAAWCWGGRSGAPQGEGPAEPAGEGPGQPAEEGPGEPVAVAGVPPLFEIVAGEGHTCGRSETEQAFCWETSGPAERVESEQPLRSLAAGGSHTCALADDRTAWCWGSNGSGQLGDGSVTDRRTPAPVDGGRRFVRLAAGERHTCALTSGGDLHCWGSGTDGQLGDGISGGRTVPGEGNAPEPFSELAAGAHHTCALTAAGVAYCWGRNDRGQLGTGTRAESRVPVPVDTDLRFGSLAAGAAHTCALTTGGREYCWGANDRGQLGDGSRDDRVRPVAVALR